MYSKIQVNKIVIYRVFDYFKYHYFHVYCKCLYINLNFLENYVYNNKLFIFFLEFPNGIF